MGQGAAALLRARILAVDSKTTYGQGIRLQSPDKTTMKITRSAGISDSDSDSVAESAYVGTVFFFMAAMQASSECYAK